MSRLAAVWIVAICALAIPRPAWSEEGVPIEYQPERVEIDLHFAREAVLVSEDRTAIRRSLADVLRRLIGARWETTIRTRTGTLPDYRPPAKPPEPRPGGQSAGDDAAAPEKPLPSADDPDKRFRVSIEPDGFGFKVTAREWDWTSNSTGPVAERAAISRNEIPRVIAAAIVAAYRPVARILNEDDTPYLMFRAAALPTPDAGLLTPEEGTLFRAILHRRDQDGALVELREVQYTYLELESLEGPRGTVKAHSALRAALGPYRGLISGAVVAAAPIAKTTNLHLVRSSDGVPLAGRRVEIRKGPPVPGEKPAEPLQVLLSDRTGRVRLTRRADQPLVWATIKSGRATLMRVPVAVGAAREIRLPLGNDGRRLDAEGRLAILTGDLIETVAKRATILAAARSRAREGEFDKAREALAGTQELPQAANFRERLAAIATPAASAAEEAGQRRTAARIRELSKQIGDLIDRYLETDPVRAAQEEIDALEQAASDT